METDAKVIIGVDDSGTGALAGPLMMCAVAFLRDDSPVTVTYKGARKDKVLVAGDSKGFSNPQHRVMLDQVIRVCAHSLALIERTNQEIDAQLMSRVFPQAVAQAIARCIESVVARGQYTDPKEFLVIIDGEMPIPPGLPCQVKAIPEADKTVWQVGAASIVAKVACDARMMEFDAKYPEWDFRSHKGYGVKLHKELLKKYGPCPVHRRTFRPVYQALGEMEGFES
jgi:ribonuclease HII